MKNTTFAPILALFTVVTLCSAQSPSADPAAVTAQKTEKVETYKAGGTPIALPCPAKDMTEVGYDNREFMEIFVAPNNRQIAAFVLTSYLPKLSDKNDDSVMSNYGLVQVPRAAEYMDCGADDFKEATSGAKEEFGDVMASSVKEAEEEFNRKMKSMNLDDLKVQIDKPVMLGCLYSKEDAYGFGMVMTASMEGKSLKMVCGGAMIRVKSRLLFVYLYREYKDENTVKAVKKTSEEWVDAILKANSDK